MKKAKLFTILCASAFIGALATGCSNNEKGSSESQAELPTVKIGLHLNLGAGAGYSAYQQGFFRAEGVNVVVETGTGPALATKLVEGSLNVSFMGGGVAWNYFTTKQEIKIAALDNLTDDDRLIATTSGKGKNLTSTSTLAEVGEALKGASVALDLTATPATFFQTLITGINATKTADADKLWYNDGAQNLPQGLETYTEGNKVTVANVTNANLTTTMQAKTYDFCVAFAPVASRLEKDTTNFKTIVKTSTHFSDAYQPSTWGVNSKWLSENEETFKKFMKGLVRGMNYRRDDPSKTCKDIETVTAGSVSASSLETDIAVWLGDKEQLELNTNGKMKKYAENIRQAKQSNENVDSSITVEKATVFNYLIDACNAVKGS